MKLWTVCHLYQVVSRFWCLCLHICWKNFKLNLKKIQRCSYFWKPHSIWGRILFQHLRLIDINTVTEVYYTLKGFINILSWFSITSNVLCTLFLPLSNHNTIIQPVLQGNNLQLFIWSRDFGLNGMLLVLYFSENNKNYKYISY